MKHTTTLNYQPVEVAYEVDGFGNVEIKQVRRMSKPPDDCVVDIASDTDMERIEAEIEASHKSARIESATEAAISNFESTVEVL